MNMIKEISSTQNEVFKYWKTLLKSKGLKEGKHFLLSGAKLVEEILQDPQWKNQIDHIVLPPLRSSSSSSSGSGSGSGSEKSKPQSTQKPLLPVLSQILNGAHSSYKITRLSQPLFEELDVLGTKSPLLILPQPKMEICSLAEAPQKLELLVPFGDPQNLGALIRTAYAFGASKVILLKEAAHPLLPKSIKASSGAVLKMPLAFGPSIQEIAAPAVAMDLKGTPLNDKKWPTHLRLLLGEEGVGIPTGFQGERMTLTMTNPIESLNAAVAAGIAIYHLTQNG